jgi:hypothetical protein
MIFAGLKTLIKAFVALLVLSMISLFVAVYFATKFYNEAHPNRDVIVECTLHADGGIDCRHK